MFKQIASNTLAQVVSKFATAVISIVLISMLTNYLTVEMYGLYGKVYNYVGLFVFLADLGLYTIAIREITTHRDDAQKIVGNIMTLRWVLGGVILFLAVGLAYFLPGYNSSVALWAIFFGSLFTMFQLFNSSIMALMQANMKMEFSLFSTVIGKLINVWLVGMVIFVWYTPETLLNYDTSFIAIIIASLIGVLFNTGMNFYYANQLTPIRFYADRRYISQLFKTSLPYWIALFLSIVYLKIDVILLSLIEWPEKWDISIALYSLPMKIVEVVMVMGWFYLSSILPYLSEYFKKNDTDQLQRMIQASFSLLLSAGVWICALGILFRENIIRIIANADYLSAEYVFHSGDAFVVVFGVIVFYFVSLLGVYLLIAAKQQSQLLRINIIVTLINIIWNILLIPHYWFMGAAVTTLLSQIILFFLTLRCVRKTIPFHIDFISTVYIIVTGVWVYILWYFLLAYISVWIYIDTLVYGWILWILYTLIIYMQIQKHIHSIK